MNSHRLATVAAALAGLVSVAYLLTWVAIWRVLATRPLPESLQLLPLVALCLLGAAVALALCASEAPHRPVRMIAGVVFAIALFVLLEHALGLRNGIEQYFLGDRVAAVLEAEAAGRPSVLVAVVLMFLSASLWSSRPERAPRFDLADVWASASLFLAFTIVLSHMFQAQVTAGRADGVMAGTSAVEGLVVVVLALGCLSLNPHGAIAALRGDNPGGAAQRRLMPAVLLTPVLLGLLQLYAVESSLLDLSLALALSITATLVVFMVLISWVSRLLNQVHAEQRGEMLERETKAKEEGMTDALTGLLNRRGWELRLKQVEERCRLERMNACVIAIDLDGLKRINDTLGHAQGDALIRRAANGLRTAARRDDYLARLGGDEFAYLAVGCEPEHAGIVVNRLSSALAKAEVQASLGYAMRDLAGSLAAAFHEADQAMYKHKRARKAQGAAVRA